MLSLCNSYSTILLAQGVGFGFFAAGLFSCGVVSVGQWFRRWKALVVGLVLSGSSAGLSSLVYVLPMALFSLSSSKSSRKGIF